jgi:hypothetical protein
VELADADARLSITLRPIAYQFGPDGSYDDNNWLVVEGAVVQRRNTWTFAEPCLRTTEAIRLADWLTRVAQHDEPPATGGAPSLTFTEPNIAFTLASYAGDSAVVRVHLSLESAPPWEQDADLLSFFLEMTVTSDQLRAAAGQWTAESAAFPERP